jgi:hypothetical protein
LISRNSVILNQIFDDQINAILFELEYVVNIPLNYNGTNLKNKKNLSSDNKKQNEIHHILAAWAIYYPFSINEKLKTIKIELNVVNSLKLPHPEGRLVYKQADEIFGKINFVIKKYEVTI